MAILGLPTILSKFPTVTSAIGKFGGTALQLATGAAAVYGAFKGGGGGPVAQPGGLPIPYQSGGRLSSRRVTSRQTGMLKASNAPGYAIPYETDAWGRVRYPRKRMNVCNVRALRRAIRRVEGFERVARKVLRITTGRQPSVRFKRTRKRR